MDILHLLPWCRLNKEYVVDDVVFSPLDVNQLSSIDVSVRADAASELQRIIDITGKPVTRITLFRLAKKGLLSEFSEQADIEEYVEALDLLSFSALARRDFLSRMDRTRLGEANTVQFGEQLEQAASAGVAISLPNCDDTYCNADCFQPCALPLGAPEANQTLVGTNRRDHHFVQSFGRGSTTLTVPSHVNSLVAPTILISPDEHLLQSLLALRRESKAGKSSKKWEDWYDGIENFNQANSDNPAVRWQTEWGLMCSAFRRVLLDKEYGAKRVSQAFGAAFLPLDPFFSKLKTCAPELCTWLYDFHTPRHDFGHGKQIGSAYKPSEPGPWLPIGSLLIAAILFPLLIRSLLVRARHYTLTDRDRCHYAAAVKLLRRFPSKKYVPAAEVRKVWMDLVNIEWSTVKSATSSQAHKAPIGATTTVTS